MILRFSLFHFPLYHWLFNLFTSLFLSIIIFFKNHLLWFLFFLFFLLFSCCFSFIYFNSFRFHFIFIPNSSSLLLELGIKEKQKNNLENTSSTSSLHVKFWSGIFKQHRFVLIVKRWEQFYSSVFILSSFISFNTDFPLFASIPKLSISQYFISLPWSKVVTVRASIVNVSKWLPVEPDQIDRTLSFYGKRWTLQNVTKIEQK